MSTSSESGLDELELQLLPSWAKESPQTNRYANFQGRDDAGDRRSRGPGDRPPFRRDGGSRPPRRDGPAPRPSGPSAGGPRPGGPGFGPRPDRGGDRGPRRFDGGGRRDERPMEPQIPLPELTAEVLPEEKGVESMTRQIKLTGRAYPLFEIGGLIVKRPERYIVRVAVMKQADGTPIQPLFACSLDDTLWLSENEAVQHVLARQFATFYQAEKTPCDAPKGIYTFVAQCGFSGVILGPPNYHDYQTKLRKLHAERFERMPFDMFKARVKIVKDEAVVKQWVEEQSFKTEFICLNVPEASRLPNRDEVEKHFRATHAGNVIRPVNAHSIPGNLVGALRTPGLRTLVRRAVDEQQRFPMKVANVLSQKFASAGLQFFKVNKTITHVAIARPHYLDLEASPVSDGIRKIIEFLNANAKCTRKKLIDALAPSPARVAVAATPAPVAAEGTGEAAAPTVPASAPAAHEPTPEQAALVGDLHWLVHQGHVIEFANGQIETAKKPLPRPEPPAKVPKPSKDATSGYLPVFLAAPLLVGD